MPGDGESSTSPLNEKKNSGEGDISQPSNPKSDKKNGGERGKEIKRKDGSGGQEEERGGKRRRTSSQTVKYVYSSNSDDDSIGSKADNDVDDEIFDDAIEENDLGEKKPTKQQKGQTKSSLLKPKETKIIKCPHCWKPFKSEGGLQYHMNKRVCIQKEAKLRKLKREARKSIEKSKPKTIEKFKCIHCDKAFKTQGGLQYHVDKRVCLNADGSTKQKIEQEQPKKKRKIITEKDRTCPHCNRIFTSMDGLKYHVEQKVCQKASVGLTGNDKGRPFPTLKPGQKFSTQFGVVQVVKDDRAIPTAILPENVQLQFRKYQKAKIAEGARDLRRHQRIASKLRFRRNTINNLYEKGKTNRRSVFDAYFGGDPEHMRSVIKANKILAGDSAKAGTKDDWRTYNPREPKESYPDRIVECMLVTDHRWHNLDLDNRRQKRNFVVEKPVKLYLQRKLLTEPYDKGDTVYYCSDCGRKYNNSQSRRFHCGQTKCIVEAKTKKEKRIASQLTIEREVGDFARFPERRKYIKNEQPAPVKKSKWKKKKKKAEPGVYPEVVIEMGFKLVRKQKITQTNSLPKPNVARTENIRKVNQAQAAVPKALPTSDIPRKNRGHELDNLLDDLKGALRIQKRKASDQRHGSIYAEVYSALGFKHPAKRKGSKVGNDVSAKKRRKRKTKPKPPPPPKPLPPTIDVGALSDEIKSGRYPSIKVFEGTHSDQCVLCKDGGMMYCCEFCGNAEHFKCLLTKFTIKEPEPDEDFMCHRCIGVILSRRARAEKRRLRKQTRNEQVKKEEEMEVIDPSDGNEYPYMASQAREVNELVELLKDSQIRLRRSIETTKLNNIRRRVIAGAYPEEYWHKLAE